CELAKLPVSRCLSAKVVRSKCGERAGPTPVSRCSTPRRRGFVLVVPALSQLYSPRSAALSKKCFEDEKEHIALHYKSNIEGHEMNIAAGNLRNSFGRTDTVNS